MSGVYTNLPVPRDTQRPCEGSSQQWAKRVDRIFLSQSSFPGLFDHFVIEWGIRTTNLICRITDFQGTCEQFYLKKKTKKQKKQKKQLSVRVIISFLSSVQMSSAQFSRSVQSLSRVRLVTPWTAACQASLSITTPEAYSNSCPSNQ